MKKFFYIFLISGFGLSSSTKAQVQPKPMVNGTIAYVQGLEAFENREYEKSLQLLMEAKNQLGNEAGLSYAIADTYFAMEDLPNAALYGKQAVSKAPENK